MSRFVRPETKTIQISHGDWLLVKKRLSAGEQRAIFARLYLAGADGALRVNPLQSGLAQILAYLLDWSLTDDNGQQVVIRDKSADDIAHIVDGLDPESFTEIREAIQRHEETMADEREEEKKTHTGVSGSLPISPSPPISISTPSGLPN